jgi:hypothetical protein
VNSFALVNIWKNSLLDLADSSFAIAGPRRL